VSFEPPMVVIAMKKGRSAEGVLRASEKFVLNILHTNQKDMMAHFGKGFKAGENPFAGIEIKSGKTGVPVLKCSLCFLECQVRYIYEAGDHHLFLGEVIEAGMKEEGQPMVHVRRNGFNY
jgi:flavin reductase